MQKFPVTGLATLTLGSPSFVHPRLFLFAGPPLTKEASSYSWLQVWLRGVPDNPQAFIELLFSLWHPWPDFFRMSWEIGAPGPRAALSQLWGDQSLTWSSEQGDQEVGSQNNQGTMNVAGCKHRGAQSAVPGSHSPVSYFAPPS